MNKLVSFYLKNTSELMHYAKQFCNFNETDAEDLLSDCLEKILSIPDEKIDNRSLKSFWVTALKNRKIDEVRKFTRRGKQVAFVKSKIEGDPYDLDMGDVIEIAVEQKHSIDSNIILKAIEQLPTNSRIAIKMKVEGYASYEIVDYFKDNENTVRAYSFRGKNKLQTQFKNIGIL